MAYIAAIALAQLAAIIYLIRERSRERAAERREAIAERADLLQRIQAPEAAVITHQIQTGPTPELVAPIPMDDDEAYHASREDLAKALARNAE